MSLKERMYSLAAKLGAKKDINGFTRVAVTVSTGQTAGTATVPDSAVPIGIVPSGNQDQLVDNVAVSSTTLTVTLAAAATADNTFYVTLVEA